LGCFVEVKVEVEREKGLVGIVGNDPFELHLLLSIPIVYNPFTLKSFHWSAALYKSILAEGTYNGIDLLTLIKTFSPKAGIVIALQVMDVKPVQPPKAPPPILVTELGIVTDVKLMHAPKATFPILVTDFGIVTEVKLMQSLKALTPILVTELGIVIDVKPEQPVKTHCPIIVTEFGIVTDVKLEHPANAQSPILATEFGIVTDVKSVHPLKTSSLI